MNYRHQFHAGNFADVLKHAVLLGLLQGLQRKEQGILYLDTHAGRGGYDLAAAARGDSLARRPEWPEGWGRVEAAASTGKLPPLAADYVAAVRDWQAARPSGPANSLPRELWYPGSPALVASRLRPQDRAVCCERHPEEATQLAALFAAGRRVRVEQVDGYAAVRAHLPPRERRALVLIDPPFEDPGEYAAILDALSSGLQRLRSGTFVVWYPLTDRARIDEFFAHLARQSLPPTWVAEVAVHGPAAPVKMKGCGVLVINPVWQLDAEVEALTRWLATVLAQSPEASGSLRWLVPE